MKNNKVYEILSTFTLVSLFLIIFCIWPLFKGIEKNSEDLILTKNNIVAFNAQVVQTGNFNKNYEVYRPNLERIDQLFVDPSNPVDFIKFLEKTATDYQITSQIAMPASNTENQNFITFQFFSKGNFSEVLNFSKKIETGPYLIEIENLTIQDSENPSDGYPYVSENYSSRKISATFTIKSFTKNGINK